MNDRRFSFSPCHIRNYTEKSPTASLCAGKIFWLTPCQNPHFILATFMLSCCLLETSLITAGVQAKVYFRTSKQPFWAVTITETDVLLPLPHMGRGQAPGPADDRGWYGKIWFTVWAGAVRAIDWPSDNSVWLTGTSACLQRPCLAWVSSECSSGVHTPGQGDPSL